MAGSTAAHERTAAPRGGALAGVRVLDLSRVLAGPLCTQILADHGAEVIKVEPPTGDETRHLGPPFRANGDAAYYTAVNRGKKAVVLNLASDEGRDVLLRLLAHTDVLVENFLPGTLARWGLDYDAVLKPRFPGLIQCSISGFGADGPLGGMPGYDAVVQAMCGLMSINGTPESGPTRMGIPVVDHVTGYTALTGILLALFHRERTGEGQHVEATLFDTALSLLVPHAANWMHSGRTPELLGSAHPNIAPYDKFICRDGAVFLGILNDRQFQRFCDHLGLTHLTADERFSSNARRLAHRAPLRQAIESALTPLSRDEICGALMRQGVPIGPVNTVPEALQQPHAQHRDMRVQREDYQGVGIPTRLCATPGRVGDSPPAFSQDTTDLLREIGFDDAHIAAMRACEVPPRQP